MGQATLELPDPLERSGPVSNAPTGDTDELLSKLAGEEIDRLLAADEVERVAGADKKKGKGGPAGPTKGAAATEDAKLSKQIDELLTTLGPTPATKPSPMTDVAAASPPRAEAQPVPAAAPPTSPVVTDPAPSGDLPRIEDTTAAERAALVDPLAEVIAAEEAAQPARDFGPVPPLLKPLVWLNIPVARCPDIVLNAIGKAAIVTLVNAVLIIGYVLIFRRHQ
jgi:hypothetical protein